MVHLELLELMALITRPSKAPEIHSGLQGEIWPSKGFFLLHLSHRINGDGSWGERSIAGINGMS